MTFRAEPYGVFVDDLISSLTGGVTRVRFRFVEEAKPFEIDDHEQVLADTVRVHGLAGNQYTRFGSGIDFAVQAGVIVWQSSASAVNPDPGSFFYASYERVPDPQRPPRLTDRNPGSVLRLLAESFAREYAVVSKQLASVYDAGFLATAEGRDLDQIAALVGLERRTQLFAVGEVVFSRATPAPGDITIEEGTRISTAEVPAVTVATTESRRLRSGSLSVAVPVQAEVPGAAGIAPATTLTVIHRPILGITSATNPETLAFRGSTETDAALRRRASHALDGAGRSTRGALVAALLSVEGVREQDVQIEEDHVAFPGVVKVTVAAELDAAHQQAAAALLDEARPAGIRVLHNLTVPAAPGQPMAPGGGVQPGPPAPPAAEDGIFSLVGVVAAVTAASATLSAAAKASLVGDVEAAIEAYVGSKGVGEQVVYNQLVASVMAVDGVYDVVIDLYPVTAPPIARSGRQNLTPNPSKRPRLKELDVTLRGALIALDLDVTVTRKSVATKGDPTTVLDGIRVDVITRLNGQLPTMTGSITPSVLKDRLTETDPYRVDHVSYTAEFVDEGLRVLSQDKEITPAADQAPWVRSATVSDSGAAP